MRHAPGTEVWALLLGLILSVGPGAVFFAVEAGLFPGWSGFCSGGVEVTATLPQSPCWHYLSLDVPEAIYARVT